MSTGQKSSLAQFLAKQSAFGRGIEQPAEVKIQSTPFFDQVVEGANGTESFEAVLTELTGPVDSTTIPQVTTYNASCRNRSTTLIVSGVEQQTHLATCPWCKDMLVAAQPSNEEFEEVCRQAKA